MGFSGITVDEISERRRKEENGDLAAHPAAFHSAVLLSTRSFGRQRSSEGKSAVGGIMANGVVIENLIKMLKKLSASSQLRRPPLRPAPNPIRELRKCKDGLAAITTLSAVALSLQRWSPGLGASDGNDHLKRGFFLAVGVTMLLIHSNNQIIYNYRVRVREESATLAAILTRQSGVRYSFKMGTLWS